MTALELAFPLIIKYGIPAGEAIYNIVKTWTGKAEITAEDWQQLKEINARPLDFYEK